MYARAARASLGILSAILLSTPCLADPAPETPPEAKPAASAATATVEALHAALLEVMRNAKSLGYQGRYDYLAPRLGNLIDLSFMAQKSVGRYWNSASPEQRKQLVDIFARYTIATYAGRFDSYDGQSFETLGEEPSARGTQLVRTRLVDPGGDDVKLDYRLHSVDGHWKIVDIYLNGTVSELALRRSEYSSLIKREGFQALLAALHERIQSLALAPADQAS